jgi:hypothetical protein
MTCAPPGTVPTGGACTTFAQCAPGNGCFPGRGACLRLCDGTHPCEGAGFRCRVGEGFPFGVCHNPSICDPIAATGCPSGQACYADRTGNLCAPAGTGARGSMCMNSTQCLPGHFCVPQAAGPPTCRPLCDGTAALACPAGSGTCRIGATGDAFGICQ